MYWRDEGYLLSKNSFDENSLIIEAFTLNHGKYSGVVFGGSSRKLKNVLQIGNKLVLNLKSKSENRIGYFTVELDKPVSPMYFQDKRKSISILAASNILKILLPERQLNKKIYHSFEKFIEMLNYNNWIEYYIFWELLLVKELGYEINFNYQKKHFDNSITSISINGRNFKIPKMLSEHNEVNRTNLQVKEALYFNRNLLMEYFTLPNKIKFPSFRFILEKYFK